MRYLVFILFSFHLYPCQAQTTLVADGPGGTYELINSVLAPDFDVIEVPDCAHDSFGRHIDEVFDNTLNKHVFRFHIHIAEDNDRCINFDRQRNEIKAYDKSPNNLKAVLDEEVEYKWKFKLDTEFQASGRFTHLHQIKAVGGPEDAMPLITLTARKGSPDQLELRHAAALSQTTVFKTDLTPFKGKWVEATERITYGEAGEGEYAILITTIGGADTLFNYSSNTIRLWKTDAEFQRPKWGIYRSIIDAQDLRDEQVLYADFSIEELKTSTSLAEHIIEQAAFQVYPNPAISNLYLSDEIVETFKILDIYNIAGQLMRSLTISNNRISIAGLNSGIHFIRFRTDRIQSQSIKILVQRN